MSLSSGYCVCVRFLSLYVCMLSCYCGELCSFFCNDTATNEIYTYGHTLSLHDALPISTPRASPRAECLRERVSPRTAYGRCRRPDNRPRPPCRARHRSEEHTSELQSLMRISYAVFCLKKKTHY